MHELYPTFLTTHLELGKLSTNVLQHRLNHLDMRMDQFATFYFNKIYPGIATNEGVAINEPLLMDDVSKFIEQLELLIIHKSYNSSKNDSEQEGNLKC